MQTITWDDFARVELRVGRIIEAHAFAAARKPAYVLQVDFGSEIGVRKSSAQITALYQPEELVGKLVVGVVNFPKKADRAADERMPGHGLPRRQRRRRAVCTGSPGTAGHQTVLNVQFALLPYILCTLMVHT